MKKPDRLAAIKKAASAAKQPKVSDKAGIAPAGPPPRSPFKPGMNAGLAAQQGAKTGFNPNPGEAPVRTLVPTRRGTLVEEGTPRLKPGVRARYSMTPPMAPEAPPAPPKPASRGRARLGPQRRSDALLDAAKAKVAQSTPQPTPPSGAKTGPRLSQRMSVGQAQASFTTAPRLGPSSPAPRPMRAAPGSRADLAYAGLKPQQPRPARAPKPAAPASPPPKLRAGVRPRSTVAPPLPRMTGAPQMPRRVGGGWRGMLVSGGINAAQAGYQEVQRKDKKK